MKLFTMSNTKYIKEKLKHLFIYIDFFHLVFQQFVIDIRENAFTILLFILIKMKWKKIQLRLSMSRPQKFMLTAAGIEMNKTQCFPKCAHSSFLGNGFLSFNPIEAKMIAIVTHNVNLNAAFLPLTKSQEALISA